MLYIHTNNNNTTHTKRNTQLSQHKNNKNGLPSNKRTTTGAHQRMSRPFPAEDGTCDATMEGAEGEKTVQKYQKQAHR